jgi:hypothetical protein
MPWIQFDDHFPNTIEVLRVLEVDPKPLGVHLLASCWTGAYLTDGTVPDEVIRSFRADPDDVTRLCDAGLWERVEGGYVLVHHLAANRSREEVEADRAAANERKRLSRERAAQRRRAEVAAHASDDGDDSAPF